MQGGIKPARWVSDGGAMFKDDLERLVVVVGCPTSFSAIYWHIKAMANPSNISFQVISKLVAAIDEFSLEREESLLPLSSALEALATTSKDMSYHAVNRLQSKLETSMNCVKTQLTTLSRRDILLVSERLVKFGLYLFEVPFFSRSTLINVSNSCGLH